YQSGSDAPVQFGRRPTACRRFSTRTPACEWVTNQREQARSLPRRPFVTVQGCRLRERPRGRRASTKPRAVGTTVPTAQRLPPCLLLFTCYLRLSTFDFRPSTFDFRLSTFYLRLSTFS